MNSETASSKTSDQSIVTCAAIRRGLIGHLRLRSSGNLTMPNVYVGSSPWESDVITVTPSGFWIEYEIKISVEDFRADFRKSLNSFNPTSARKHDLYAADEPIVRRSDWGDRLEQIVPKPKQFYFAVPAGLLAGVEVPKHCGVAEFTIGDRHGWGVVIVRRAPNLKSPTQLCTKSIFRLGMKAAHRLRMP